MGVYANGHVIYGFVHTDETDELFRAISQAGPESDYDTLEEEGNCTFEEIHGGLQEKWKVSLFEVGFANVEVLSAFSVNASGKGMDIHPIKVEDLAKTEEYAGRIRAFLTELGIDATKWDPGWYLLGYMD